MEEKKEFKLGVLNYAALMAVCLMSGMPGLVSPTIQTAIQTFPDVPTATIRMLTTLPNLVSMFVGLVMGSVIGNKVKYKPLCIVGAVCAVIGGLGPFFLHDTWTQVLIFRAILGVGVATGTFKGALVMKSVSLDKRALWVGFGSAAAPMMQVIFQPVAGGLADQAFHKAFIVYLIPAVILILELFFLKEPPQAVPGEVKNEEVKVEEPKTKEKFNPWLIGLLAISLLNITCLYPFNTGVSSYVVSKGVGTALIAGTALSIYTFSGMAGNLLLKPIEKVCGKYLLAVTDLCISLGLVIIVNASGRIGIFAAGVICGFGYIVGTSALQLAAGKISTPKTLAIYATAISCISGGGAFISSYYITLAHKIVGAASEVESAYKLSIFVFAALAVFGFVFANKLADKPKEKN